MNQKYFDAFSKYRERRYQRELDELQHDLERRGLIQSSERTTKEARLKADYEDEILMKKEEMAILEEERGDQKKERRNGFWTNGIIAGATVITIVVGFVFGILQSKNTANQIALQQEQIDLEYRPFIGTYPFVEDPAFLITSTTTQEALKSLAGCNFSQILFDQKTSSTIFSIPIKNYGKTPARYHLGDLELRTPSSIRQFPSSLLTVKDGYLMPDESLTIKYQLPIGGLRLEPGIQVQQIEYRSRILYHGPHGKEHASSIAVRSKPTQIASNVYCSEVINDEDD